MALLIIFKKLQHVIYKNQRYSFKLQLNSMLIPSVYASLYTSLNPIKAQSSCMDKQKTSEKCAIAIEV